MAKQNNNGSSAIAVVADLVHDDNFPTKRRLEFVGIGDVPITVDANLQLNGWRIGNLLGLTEYGRTRCRSEIINAQKIAIVGFSGGKVVIQIDDYLCTRDNSDATKQYFKVIGIDKEMAADINAVSLEFDGQNVAAPLPDFKVKPGNQVLFDPANMRIVKLARSTQMLAASRTRLDPRSIGQEGERLSKGIKSLVIGQDQAIAPILSAYQRHRANLSDSGRPAASILMLGPTGTGKTRTAEALAECLLGNRQAVVKIDCAEFQHSHEISKIIGSPPGYLGHRETKPLLSQEALDKYSANRKKLSIVLFDEIEKASDALWNLMLGILDKATLTLGDNRHVDFSNSMIFCTSNLGAKDMLRFAEVAQKLIHEGKSVDRKKLAKDVESVGLAAARSKFSPEFVNRFDKIVSFVPLMEAELMRILDIELGFVQHRTERNHGFSFRVQDSAKKFLLEKGTDMRYGARELKRTIEHYVTHPLANLVVSGQTQAGSTLDVGIGDGNDTEYPLMFEMVSEELAEKAAAGD